MVSWPSCPSRDSFVNIVLQVLPRSISAVRSSIGQRVHCTQASKDRRGQLENQTPQNRLPGCFCTRVCGIHPAPRSRPWEQRFVASSHHDHLSLLSIPTIRSLHIGRAQSSSGAVCSWSYRLRKKSVRVLSL